MTDRLQVRAFNSQQERFLKNAKAEAAAIETCLSNINADLETGESVAVALGYAKNMARYAADLVSALSSLATLHDMRFVVDPDEKES